MGLIKGHTTKKVALNLKNENARVDEHVRISFVTSSVFIALKSDI